MRRAALILVSGTVQGVGLRYAVSDRAIRRGIVGCVENLDDGTVRIECEGEADDIEGLIRSTRDSGEPIRVKDVDVQYSEDAGRFRTFRIVPGDMASEMVKGFATGAMYLSRIDQKQDQMLNKQDQMLNKQDQTVTEIRSLSSNIRDMLDSRFERIENDISQIKSKLQI